MLSRWLGRAKAEDFGTEAPPVSDVDPQSGVRLVSPKFPRLTPLQSLEILAYIADAASGVCGEGE